MATLTIRLPEDRHNRLKALAKHKKISVNKLIEELSTIALTEFDAETRFRALAAKGSRERELEILDQLDKAFSDKSDVYGMHRIPKQKMVRDAYPTRLTRIRYEFSH